MAGKWNSDTIEALRERTGQTQEMFAAELGVTVVTVNRWIKGHAVPSRLARKMLNELASNLDREGR